jgi:hypothetical protein
LRIFLYSNDQLATANSSYQIPPRRGAWEGRLLENWHPWPLYKDLLFINKETTFTFTFYCSTLHSTLYIQIRAEGEGDTQRERDRAREGEGETAREREKSERASEREKERASERGRRAWL